MNAKKMNGARYQLGDIVKLKSGGENMVIYDFAVMKVNPDGSRNRDNEGVESFAGKYYCRSQKSNYRFPFSEEELELSVDL